MSNISRRGLLVGLGTAGSARLVAQPALAVDDKWGTGCLATWNAKRGYGVYRDDADGSATWAMLQRPFAPCDRLHPGARVAIEYGSIRARDGTSHALQRPAV